MSEKQASFFASINGWKSELVGSAANSLQSSSADISDKGMDTTSLDNESMSANDGNETKWPVELAGDFELAAMIMVCSNCSFLHRIM